MRTSLVKLMHSQKIQRNTTVAYGKRKYNLQNKSDWAECPFA